MTDSLAQQVVDLQQRIAAAELRHTHAQIAADSAAAELQRAREQLKERFGIESPEQARAEIASLHTQLQTVMAQLSQALDEAGQ
jgi:predicted  nucleic acid-binding Zn-ribbon protein